MSSRKETVQLCQDFLQLPTVHFAGLQMSIESKILAHWLQMKVNDVIYLLVLLKCQIKLWLEDFILTGTWKGVVVVDVFLFNF